MQGVRPCHFIDPSFCQSRHALKQSMWLVWLHSSYMFIWNQQGFHIGSCKKKPEASQKQSKPEENQNLVLNCLGLSETRTEIPTEITEIRTETRTEIRTDFRTDGMIGNNIIRTDCHMISIFCMFGGQTIDFMEIALGSGISILFLKGSWPAVLYQ